MPDVMCVGLIHRDTQFSAQANLKNQKGFFKNPFFHEPSLPQKTLKNPFGFLNSANVFFFKNPHKPQEDHCVEIALSVTSSPVFVLKLNADFEGFSVNFNKDLCAQSNLAHCTSYVNIRMPFMLSGLHTSMYTNICTVFNFFPVTCFN